MEKSKTRTSKKNQPSTKVSLMHSEKYWKSALRSTQTATNRHLSRSSPECSESQETLLKISNNERTHHPQKAAVLAYLKQGYSITPMQALDMLHVNCLVVLTILAAQCGLNLETCFAVAWAEIKDRKGQTVGGTFIKE